MIFISFKLKDSLLNTLYRLKLLWGYEISTIQDVLVAFQGQKPLRIK